jgi:hypothetical protein
VRTHDVRQQQKYQIMKYHKLNLDKGPWVYHKQFPEVLIELNLLWPTLCTVHWYHGTRIKILCIYK